MDTNPPQSVGSENDGEPDAFTELVAQNKIVSEMLDVWEQKTELLQTRDSVDDRWRRGSAVKLLLQHLAVREAAKQDVVARLREVGQPSLADRLEGDGPKRREAIDRLDEATRGRQAINLNYPEADRAVALLADVFRGEASAEESEILPAIAGVLGESAGRGLPSARSVQRRSDTHPSPVPRWYDRSKPLKRVIAFYDHLRATPSGLTSPGVDEGREHSPGPHPKS